MNKDDILNMSAGYEMNKLIAEFVFGMRLEENYGLAGGFYWVGNGVQFGQVRAQNVPDYSTDIEAAWVVVEKICNENGCDIVKVCKRDPELLRGEWSCNFGLGFESFGETAPHAICRSALLARGLTPREPDGGKSAKK